VTRLAIIVDIRVKPDAGAEFARLISENAAASLEREPGCVKFDILVPEGEVGGQFLLYEIYADPGAFEAHLGSDHYKRFDAATSAIVTEKVVTRLRFLGAQ
jgi:quinol monooxygenase YgiN